MRNLTHSEIKILIENEVKEMIKHDKIWWYECRARNILKYIEELKSLPPEVEDI